MKPLRYPASLPILPLTLLCLLTAGPALQTQGGRGRIAAGTLSRVDHLGIRNPQGKHNVAALGLKAFHVR
jgi:hypothetical protein